MAPVSDRVRDARLRAELTAEERSARSSRQTGPLTQEELAARMGVRREVVNKIESGHLGVGPVTAQRLANALGGEPEDWLENQASVQSLRDEIATMRVELDGLKETVTRLAGLIRSLAEPESRPPTQLAAALGPRRSGPAAP